MNPVLESLSKIGLVPVIKLDTPDQALPLGKALIDGGLPVAEVTFRSDAAEESIKRMSKAYPELILGAGTVLTTTQVDTAVAAGASYIVTPGFNPKVVAYCIEKGVPVTPGTSSASQVEQAIEMGLKVAKFFPAEPSGGVAMLKAFAGPYGDRISFIPTGGVSPKNLISYITCPNVFAVGGSWMVPGDAMKAGDFGKIEALCREARMLSLGLSLSGIGINPEANGEPAADAKLLASILGVPATEGSDAVLIGSSFAFAKGKPYGTKGSIALSTLSVERALGWFEGFGIKAAEGSIKTKGKKAVSAVLDREIAGFAVYINKK